MRFNVISNLNNGAGLQQDVILLTEALEQRGHTVRGVQFNARPLSILAADVNIFLEVVTPLAFKAAAKQWAIPNPEWWFSRSGWDNYAWDLILAKTHDCERIFSDKVGSRCQYLGWTARDLFRPDVVRQRRFLHVAGKSRFKNSPAVITGCHLARVPLTLIGEHTGGVRRRIADPELTRAMNTHFCHVMPSMYEGYGHILHEAQSAGQIIITTDAPPMNELTPAVLVPSVGRKEHHAGILHQVDGTGVAQAIQQVLDMTAETITRYQREARAMYQVEQIQFYQALDRLVGRAPC